MSIRILIRWAGRAPSANLLSDLPHVVRVILPWPDFDHLLHTAFEQIRHYSISDAAVSLRLLRALDDLAATIDDERMREGLRFAGDASSLAARHVSMGVILKDSSADWLSL